MIRKNSLFCLIFILNFSSVYCQQGKIKVITPQDQPLDLINIFIPKADTSLLTNKLGEAAFNFGNTSGIADIPKQHIINRPGPNHYFLVGHRQKNGYVFDLSGRKIGATTCKDGLAYFDGSHLAEGIYFHKAGNIVQKFIILHNGNRISPPFSRQNSYLKSAQKEIIYDFTFNHTEGSYFRINSTTITRGLDDATFNDLTFTIEPLPFLTKNETLSGSIGLSSPMAVDEFYVNVSDPDGTGVMMHTFNNNYSLDFILGPDLLAPYEKTLPVTKVFTVGTDNERIGDIERAITIGSDTTINFLLPVDNRNLYNVTFEETNGLTPNIHLYGATSELLSQGSMSFSVDTAAQMLDLYAQIRKEGYADIDSSFAVYPGTSNITFEMQQRRYLYDVVLQEQNGLDSISYVFLGKQGETIATGNSITQPIIHVDTTATELELFGTLSKQGYVSQQTWGTYTPGRDTIPFSLSKEKHAFSITPNVLNQYEEGVVVNFTASEKGRILIDDTVFGTQTFPLDSQTVTERTLETLISSDNLFQTKDSSVVIGVGENTINYNVTEYFPYGVNVHFIDQHGDPVNEVTVDINGQTWQLNDNQITAIGTSTDSVLTAIVHYNKEGYVAEKDTVNLHRGEQDLYKVLQKKNHYATQFHMFEGETALTDVNFDVKLGGVSIHTGLADSSFTFLKDTIAESLHLDVTLNAPGYHEFAQSYTITPETKTRSASLEKELHDINYLVKFNKLDVNYTMYDLYNNLLTSGTTGNTFNALLQLRDQREESFQGIVQASKEGYIDIVDTVVIEKGRIQTYNLQEKTYDPFFKFKVIANGQAQDSISYQFISTDWSEIYDEGETNQDTIAIVRKNNITSPTLAGELWFTLPGYKRVQRDIVASNNNATNLITIDGEEARNKFHFDVRGPGGDPVPETLITVLDSLGGIDLGTALTNNLGIAQLQISQNELHHCVVKYEKENYHTSYHSVSISNDGNSLYSVLPREYTYPFSGKGTPHAKLVGLSGNLELFTTTIGADSAWNATYTSLDQSKLSGVKIVGSLDEHHDRTINVGTVFDKETTEKLVELSHYVYDVKNQVRLTNQFGNTAKRVKYDLIIGEETKSGTIDGNKMLTINESLSDTLNAVLRLYGQETIDKNIMLTVNGEESDFTVDQKTYAHRIVGSGTSGSKLNVVGEPVTVQVSGNYSTNTIHSVDSIASFVVNATKKGYASKRATITGHGDITWNYSLSELPADSRYSFDPAGSSPVNGGTVTVLVDGKAKKSATISNNKWYTSFTGSNETLSNVVLRGTCPTCETVTVNLGTIESGSVPQNISVPLKAGTGTPELYVTFTSDGGMISVSGGGVSSSGSGSVRVSPSWGSTLSFEIDGTSSKYGAKGSYRTPSTPGSQYEYNIHVDQITKQGSFTAQDIKDGSGSTMAIWATGGCIDYYLGDSFRSEEKPFTANAISDVASQYNFCVSQSSSPSASVVVELGHPYTNVSTRRMNGLSVITGAEMQISTGIRKEFANRLFGIATTDPTLHQAIRNVQKEFYDMGSARLYYISGLR